MVDRPNEADVAAVGGGTARNTEEVAVIAAQPNRWLAVTPEPQHDLFVDLADQHHLRDLNRRLVADAQPTAKLDREAKPLHVFGDLGASTVHNDRVEADVLEQHYIARELLAERGVLHRRAAVLDHDRLTVELADVWQRLEQRCDVSCGLDWVHGLSSCSRR